MSMSCPTVHSVEAPPLTDVAPIRVRMKDVQGMPGTAGSLVLRLCQLSFSGVSLAVMASTNYFPSATAFCYLVAAVSLQGVWSLSLAIVDLYAIFVGRSLRNSKVVWFFTTGDGLLTDIIVPYFFMEITSTLTFSAACASAGITVLIANDLNKCDVNHCKRFESATSMAFISWFVVSPSFLLNFWCWLHDETCHRRIQQRAESQYVDI